MNAFTSPKERDIVLHVSRFLPWWICDILQGDRLEVQSNFTYSQVPKPLRTIRTGSSTRKSFDTITPKSRRKSGQYTPSIRGSAALKPLENKASRIVEKEERATGHVEIRMYKVCVSFLHFYPAFHGWEFDWICILLYNLWCVSCLSWHDEMNFISQIMQASRFCRLEDSYNTSEKKGAISR